MTEPPPFAWIAGVIDARAHIESHNRHGHVQPRLRVTTRDTLLLQTLSEFTGTKVVLDQRGYRRKPCGEHCEHAHSDVVRQSAQWTVDSARATVILWNIAPLMFAKRVDASLALEAGLKRYPPARGDLPVQMAGLGWELPPKIDWMAQ